MFSKLFRSKITNKNVNDYFSNLPGSLPHINCSLVPALPQVETQGENKIVIQNTMHHWQVLFLLPISHLIGQNVQSLTHLFTTVVTKIQKRKQILLLQLYFLYYLLLYSPNIRISVLQQQGSFAATLGLVVGFTAFTKKVLGNPFTQIVPIQ